MAPTIAFIHPAQFTLILSCRWQMLQNVSHDFKVSR